MSAPVPDLEAIRERVEAASEGPWFAADPALVADEGAWSVQNREGEVLTESYEGSPADVVFAAHARADIPALLAEVARLREEVRTLRHCIRGAAEFLGDLEASDDPIADPETDEARAGAFFMTLGDLKRHGGME